MARPAEARDWYDEEAKRRQAEATTRGNKTRHGKELPVQEIFPELAPSSGQARDQVGKVFGVNAARSDSRRR
jgi:hypothetical protein